MVVHLEWLCFPTRAIVECLKIAGLMFQISRKFQKFCWKIKNKPPEASDERVPPPSPPEGGKRADALRLGGLRPPYPPDARLWLPSGPRASVPRLRRGSAVAFGGRRRG